jgi:hypothetical protein
MKHVLMTIFVVLFAGALLSSQAFAEKSEAMEIPDESGRPLSGIGQLVSIDNKKKVIVIDEYQFFFTESSEFQTEDSKPLALNQFQPQMLVRFEANGRGEIITLWRYIDAEGEYSFKNSPANSNNTLNNSAPGKTIKKDKITKEKGVWKN